MTKAEERRLMLQNQKTTTNTSNNGGTSKAEQRRAMLKNVTNTAPINNTAQANAYNTLLNATNVSTYDEVQTKTTKKEKVLNSISNGQQYRVTGAKRVFNDINKGEQYNSEAKAYTKWATQPASDSVYRDYSLNNLDVSNLNKLNLKYYGQSGSTDENKNYLRDYIMLKRDLASGKLTSTYSKITGKEYNKIPTVDEYVKDVENYETEKDKTFSGKLENGVQGIGQAIKTMANATTSTVTNIYDSITKPDFNIPIDTKNITSYNPGYANMSLLQIAKETGDKELASKSNQANHAIGQLELWTKTYATKGEAKQVMDNLIAELKNGTYQGTDEDVKKTIEQVKTIIANENKTTWANDLYARTLEENEYRYSEPAKKFVNALGTATEQLPTLTMAVAGGAPASTFGIYSSAEGSAIKQALNEGATYEDARKYGMGVGLAETGIETLSGGVTNKVLGIPGFINMTSNITNPYVRGFINYTGDVLGESFEEGISGVIEPYIRKATYDPNAGFKNFGEALTAFTNNYVESILPTMLMSAGTNIVNTTQMARIKKDVDNYYNEFENVIKASNLTENQKQEAIREIEKTKKEVLKQAFNQDENLQNTTQSNTNLAQISPNNEQISQNNVQNVSNLKNAVQNDVKALPSNNTVGNVSRQELLNMSNELQHKGKVFVDDRFAKALKSDSNIVKLENVVLKTNKLSELRKLAKNLTNKFIDSKVKNSDTNMDVTIGKKGIKETVSKDLNQDKIESIQELPKLIEEAVYKNSSIDIDEKNNIYHYLVSLAENGNSEKILNYITLKETPNNIKFHYNTTEKIEDSPMSSRSGNNAEHVIPTSDEPSVNNIIPNSQNYVNNQQINLPTQAEQQAEQEINLLTKQEQEEKVAEILDDSVTKKNNIKELAQDTVTTFRRMFVDSGADIAEIGKIANDEDLYYMYNSAKQAGQSANYMISDAQTNLQGDVVGKSLTDIFEPIRQKGQDYYKEFEYYMYHLHNIDRMSLKQRALEELQAFEIENQDYAVLSNEELEQLAKQEIKEKSEIQIANEYLRLIDKYEKAQNKPVFGKTVTSENSKNAVREFEKEHPEFKEYAEDIRKWNTNLQQFRVDTGLISQEQADLMNEIYPNYVPTYRDVNGISGATKNGNTVRIVNTIKKATGSSRDILPLHEQMARQVMQTVQAGRRNILGMQLYNDVIKNADKLGKYVQEIRDAKEDVNIDADFEFEKPELEGNFVVYNDGKKVEMQVSNGVLDGLKALSPAKWESNILSKGAKKVNSTFKKLVTEWNPAFIVKNAVRDIQDAGFYSENAKKFYKNYPQAWKEITSNSEIWQKYLAMGGSDASLFDFEQGYVVPKDGIPSKVINKIGEANFLVEQAPRFAEFLRIYNNSDKSYSSLMKAMYGAADITVNFGRSGTWGKFINNNLVPFFNPAVQGTSKTLRTIKGDSNVKGAKNYAKHMANIVGKGVLLGVTPTMINHILLSVFGGDDYDDLNERDKDMYFLIPTGDGKYFKLPKGRVLSVIGGFARRGFEYAEGDKNAYKGFGKFALEQIAPSNPFENNIYSPIQAVRNNTTWYGTPIENETLQNYRPSQRYDEGTTEFAKGLGKIINYSPKKIDYLLDAYGGVVADWAMPLMTKKAETSGVGKSFILDSTYSNKLSIDFYDTIEQLTYDKNDDDQVAKMQLKYMNDVKQKAQDVNKEIKDLQASNTEDKEKLEKVRELRKEVNTLQRDALNTYEKYGETANKYLNDDSIIELALRGAKEDITEESKQERIEEIVKLYTDKEIFGSEYALKEYDKKLIEKQKESRLDADTFFKIYFAQKGVRADKNRKGESIDDTAKANKIQAMHKAVPKLTPWELNKLYDLLN